MGIPLKLKLGIAVIVDQNPSPQGGRTAVTLALDEQVEVVDRTGAVWLAVGDVDESDCVHCLPLALAAPAQIALTARKPPSTYRQLPVT